MYKGSKLCLFSFHRTSTQIGIFVNWQKRYMNQTDIYIYNIKHSSAQSSTVEHYLLCPAAWQVLTKHRSIQLDPCRRNRQAMLLATRGLSDEEVTAIAVAIYAIARTVQALSGSHGCEAAPLLRLYIQEGHSWVARHYSGSATCRTPVASFL